MTGGEPPCALTRIEAPSHFVPPWVTSLMSMLLTSQSFSVLNVVWVSPFFVLTNSARILPGVHFTIMSAGASNLRMTFSDPVAMLNANVFKKRRCGGLGSALAALLDGGARRHGRRVFRAEGGGNGSAFRFARSTRNH